ncbi:PREDICTED: monocarboxylate transporter 9 [Atta cephalotes]|uniref:Major facilitator superfamily (MFS) profile domain-containing protein n=2 Tax=Atta TaxID=12956 RepID=A0A158P3N2_ATTCE|nr:PREDICTED: monocarboxylate transporter 9 [Atta cephalotes]XP_018059282.1 PREDICTED: monocarboxylate transporter 9 [Atta colombica]KYM93180.1 Monocarboxylate transporter 12-B [Atta colombica]
MTMQRVQDQDNGINIKFGPNKPRKGDYRLVSQSSNNQDRHNGTNKLEKNEKKEEELVPPDGGWGWLILLAAVMVNLLIPGTIKSFGVLFVEFLDIFDASPAAAAWIPSLCYFLYSSLGPLSSVLSVKYSYRTVTLIGGTFAAAGMMLSYFANSVAFLCVSYGVFVGTGAGLAFPPTVYIVTSYFVRFRGLANGLCISGSALGSIFLPPVLGFLLREYGYRGAVLIMGAVTLNVWASALLYHPVEWHLVSARPPDDSEVHDNGETMSVTVTSSPEQATEKGNSQLASLSNSTNEKAAPIVPKSASSVALEYYKNTPVQGRTRKISMPTGREISGQMHSTPTLHAVPERGGAMVESAKYIRTTRSPLHSPSTSSFNYVSTPYHGSTLSVLHPERASTLTLNAISSTFTRKSTIREQKRREHDEKDQQNKFFDFSLLKDPIYLVILISNSTNAISYTNFVILLPAYAISLGFDNWDASLLLSIVSMLDLVGRIGGSALSDIKIMPKHWYFVGGLLASGISLAIMPTSNTYTMLSVYCAFFGLASGIYVGITAVIMADMLGTEKLTSSYGISLFVNGVIQLVGPPICGIVFEQIGSYGPIFSILGIILVFGSSLWIMVPFIRKRQAALEKPVRIDKI